MLWQPSEDRISKTRLYHFIHQVDKNYPLSDMSYDTLYNFSVKNSRSFWKTIVQYFGIKYEGELEPVNLDPGFESYGWFPNVSLNFAENLLQYGEDYKVAIKSLLENGSKREFTYGELKDEVAALQADIKAHISPGDVVACYMPNIAETVITMLAATGLGGVFTSTSADFGVDGVLDRFSQSKPKVLVACAGYEYNGKYYDTSEKLKEIASQLDSVEKVIVVDLFQKQLELSSIDKAISWEEATKKRGGGLKFVPRKFSDPVYIMYSSGTTGKPKCIVHAVGGVLLQHIKELGLHTDHGAEKNIFFFTTCGWMMWNWLVSSLYFGGTTTLYEGSPAFPSFEGFWQRLSEEKVNILGTSPKYLKALEDSGTKVKDIEFDTLESILCTGSPLLPEQFDYVYKEIKSDVMLASISGGTDIIGCFFLGNPIGPVYKGELQCRGLGMDVACYDENGNEVEGEGELVCKQSFPSRPIYFLGDKSGSKIRDAYFNKYKNIWYHGDFIEIRDTGGAIIYGRSDATLNPGGVRIGTSEIYRQTDSLPYVEDAVCIGKQEDGDVSVMLFLKMKAGEDLTEERVAEVRAKIKSNTTPRHVPKYVHAIADIPYTQSGKKVEIAVTRVVNGKEVNNKQAIANPESLDEYVQYA